MKNGLKWVLVPNAKKPYVPSEVSDDSLVVSTSSATYATPAVTDMAAATTSITTTAEESVTTVATVAASQISTLSAPSLSATEMTDSLASLTADPSTVVGLEGVEAVVSPAPLPPLVEPVLQILPQTTADVVVGASSSSTSSSVSGSAAAASMDFEQVLQGIRENHWARMPHIQETGAMDEDTLSKAPLFGDFLRERSAIVAQDTEALMKTTGATLAPLVQDIREQVTPLARQIQEQAGVAIHESEVALAHARTVAAGATEEFLRGSEAQYSHLVMATAAARDQWAQQQASLVVPTLKIDPELFQTLKEKIEGAESQSISMEELKDFFALDQSKIDNVKTLLALDQSKIDQLTTLFDFDRSKIDLVTTATASSWTDFVASLAAIKATMGQDAITWDDLVNAMNLKETGTWYFASAFLAVFFTFALGGSGDKDRKIFLTEAAMPSDDSTSGLLVNEEVLKLKEATTAMYVQLNSMSQEKSTRAYELATLKSDLRSVNNRLDANIAEEKQLRMAMQATQAHLERETLLLKEQLQERIAAEDVLRRELAESQLKLVKEMEKVKKAKKESEQDVMAAQALVKQLEEEDRKSVV